MERYSLAPQFQGVVLKPDKQQHLQASNSVGQLEMQVGKIRFATLSLAQVARLATQNLSVYLQHPDTRRVP